MALELGDVIGKIGGGAAWIGILNDRWTVDRDEWTAIEFDTESGAHTIPAGDYRVYVEVERSNSLGDMEFTILGETESLGSSSRTVLFDKNISTSSDYAGALEAYIDESPDIRRQIKYALAVIIPVEDDDS